MSTPVCPFCGSADAPLIVHDPERRYHAIPVCSQCSRGVEHDTPDAPTADKAEDIARNVWERATALLAPFGKNHHAQHAQNRDTVL